MQIWQTGNDPVSAFSPCPCILIGGDRGILACRDVVLDATEQPAQPDVVDFVAVFVYELAYATSELGLGWVHIWMIDSDCNR